MQTIQIFRKTKNRDLSSHLVRPVVKITIPQRNVTLQKGSYYIASQEQSGGRQQSGSTENHPKQFR